MKYKTPTEAGIACFVPPPKQDRRHQPKTKPFSRKWITKGEAIARGYSL